MGVPKSALGRSHTGNFPGGFHYATQRRRAPLLAFSSTSAASTTSLTDKKGRSGDVPGRTVSNLVCRLLNQCCR